MLFCFSVVFAQEKNEVEKRVKKKQVPQSAKAWMKDAYEKKSRVNWYFQTDGEKKVYEAKLFWKNKKHSIEFDTLGKVINIEILIDQDEIKIHAAQKIQQYFDENYNKFSIKKIQIQYTGDADDLEDIIDEDEFDEDLEIKYEIEFYGKNEDANELWEGLFDQDGKLLEKRIVNIKATDNLDY